MKNLGGSKISQICNIVIVVVHVDHGKNIHTQVILVVTAIIPAY